MIVNLTGHNLFIYDEDGNLVLAIQQGPIARIANERVKIGMSEGVPLYETELGEPEGLPEPQPGTIYVVSGLFRSQHDRPDLWQPGRLLRDKQGCVVGCVGLSR